MEIKEIIQHLLGVEDSLIDSMNSELIEPNSFISWQGIKMISEGTLITIQGKSGSHKSRLAQEIAMVLLSPKNPTPNNLGMSRIDEDPITVVYLDTERNSGYELPMALKSISDASKISTPNSYFRYTSLRDLPREDRRIASQIFLEHIRNECDGRLCVILDVATDISQDFNSVVETMKVLDQLKSWMNTYKCAVIAVIHENPGSEKMRGHLGTEFLNKASDALSIKLHDDDTITIKFEKCRNYKKPNKVNAIYNDNTGRLELNSLGCKGEYNIQASFEGLLIELFKEKKVYSKTDLVNIAKERLKRKKDSIEDYIKAVTTLSIDGADFELNREMDKKEAFYSLKSINSKAAALN